MIPYPNIDPVLVRIGPLALRWYGLMYLAGFVAGFFVVRNRYLKTVPDMEPKKIENMVLWACLGLVLGARIGYVLFYHWVDFSGFLADPLEIFAVWHGGMSFHGGLLGAILFGVTYLKRNKMPVIQASDASFHAVPIGLALGRWANFINAELYCRVTDLPWGMIFPGGGPLPRHPSQLYELILEGPILFFILWLVRDKTRPGAVTALFMILYGVFRFTVEFVRQPDPQLGFVLAGLTMGQLLSLAQIGGGFIFWKWVRGRSAGRRPGGER